MSKQEIKEATKRAMAAKKAATAAGPSGRKYDSVHKPAAGAKIDLYPEAKLAFTQAEAAFKAQDFAQAQARWGRVPEVLAEVDPQFDAAEAARDRVVASKQREPPDQQHKPTGAKGMVPKYAAAMAAHTAAVDKMIAGDFHAAQVSWQQAANIIDTVESALRSAEAARDAISTRQEVKEKKYDFMHKLDGMKKKELKYPIAAAAYTDGAQRFAAQEWGEAEACWSKAAANIEEIHALFVAAEAARDAVSKTKDRDPYNFQHKPQGAKNTVSKYPSAVTEFNSGAEKFCLQDFAGANTHWLEAANIMEGVDVAMRSAERVRDVLMGQKDKNKRYDYMHKPAGVKKKEAKFPVAISEFETAAVHFAQQEWAAARQHWETAARIINPAFQLNNVDLEPEPEPELEPGPEPELHELQQQRERDPRIEVEEDHEPEPEPEFGPENESHTEAETDPGLQLGKEEPEPEPETETEPDTEPDTEPELVTELETEPELEPEPEPADDAAHRWEPVEVVQLNNDLESRCQSVEQSDGAQVQLQELEPEVDEVHKVTELQEIISDDAVEDDPDGDGDDGDIKNFAYSPHDDDVDGGEDGEVIEESEEEAGDEEIAEGVPPDPTAVKVAVSALTIAGGDEVRPAMSALNTLTQGSRHNCETATAAQGKQVVAKVLAASTDINIHCSGMRVLLGLVNVEDLVQEESEPTGGEADAGHCEAQVNGGKDWEPLTFVVKNGSMFVFRRCEDSPGDGKLTKLFKMPLKSCILQPPKNKRKRHENAFRVDMPSPAGRKKENIKLIIDPKNDAAARLADWCLHGATAFGIPAGENQNKVIFDKALANATVKHMAILAAKPQPPKPDPPHTTEVRSAIASMRLFSDQATSQTTQILEIGWKILKKLVSKNNLPTVLAEGIVALLQETFMGLCCDKRVVGRICELIQLLIKSHKKGAANDFDALVSDAMVSIGSSLADSIDNGFHGAARMKASIDQATARHADVAAILAVPLVPEPEPPRPEQAKLQAFRDDYTMATKHLQIALRNSDTVMQQLGECADSGTTSTAAKSVDELARLEKLTTDKQLEAQQFEVTEMAADEEAKTTVRTPVQIRLCKSNGRPTSNIRWIWVNPDNSLEWSKKPDKKGKGPFEMLSATLSADSVVTITTAGDTILFTNSADSPPRICDTWHRGCNALLDTPRWCEQLESLHNEHAELEALRVEARQTLDNVVTELQSHVQNLDVFISQAEDMAAAEDAAIATQLQTRMAELEGARIRAITCLPSVEQTPTVIVAALEQVKMHLVDVEATNTVELVMCALEAFLAVIEVRKVVPLWAGSPDEIPVQLTRNVLFLSIVSPH
eukprot:COSAG01_NODE_4547_length_4932_cov_6.375336_1_plen_1334_part_10